MDCSQNLLGSYDEDYLIEQIYTVANKSQLFDKNDIKVRINAYKNYSVGNKKDDFIHIFAWIMQGRSTEQKAKLSQQVVTRLTALYPNVSNIAMNISEFEKATYCNKNML